LNETTLKEELFLSGLKNDLMMMMMNDDWWWRWWWWWLCALKSWL